MERCGGGLDTSPAFNWSDELSPGELQRLCFARLFFHRPRIAILVRLFKQHSFALFLKYKERTRKIA
jgi:hypothetical protein